MYTIQTVRMYPESKMFLCKDGKRICKIDRSNTTRVLLPDNREEISVTFNGQRFYYDHKRKITKIEVVGE